MRTLLLREDGLPEPGDLRVEGLAPVVSASRPLRAGAFPTRSTLALPLSGPGAWLVRFDADGASTATLLVRSDLELHPTDGAERRVAARLAGRPATAAGVRALAGGEVVATDTDARGVAIVPAHAPTFAWSGAHVAFTPDALAGATRRRPTRAPSQRPDVLQQRMQQREQQRRASNLESYDFIGDEVKGGVRAEEL